MKTTAAFPNRSNALEGGHTDPGMELRDYFAAHAPQEIPKWFEPVMEPKPKRMDYLFNYFGKDSYHPQRNLFIQYWNDETEEWEDDGEVPESFKAEVRSYIENFRSNSDELKAWELEYAQQRIFQWPWHYADGMLKARVREQEVHHA